MFHSLKSDRTESLLGLSYDGIVLIFITLGLDLSTTNLILIDIQVSSDCSHSSLILWLLKALSHNPAILVQIPFYFTTPQILQLNLQGERSVPPYNARRYVWEVKVNLLWTAVSAEQHAGNLRILTAAKRAGLFTGLDNVRNRVEDLRWMTHVSYHLASNC